MLGIAVELQPHDPMYEDMVLKFAEHFVFIAAAMDRIGDNQDELWDEEDGFFYDVLRLPDGSAQRLKVRSMVGLLPLCATTILPLERRRELERRPRWPGCGAGSRRCPSCSRTIHDAREPGVNGRRMLAVLDETKLRRDPRPDARRGRVPQPARAAGAVALPRRAPVPLRRARPDATRCATCRPSRTPACSAATRTGAGPVWFPVNYLILRGLLHLYAYYGDDFKVECPTGSGTQCTLFEVATELGRRLASIFLPDEDGRRPVYGGTEKFQTDPHWKDLVLFYEYFHGDNGAGLGASHQTGWTGLVARVIQVLGYLRAGGCPAASGLGTATSCTARRRQ